MCFSSCSARALHLPDLSIVSGESAWVVYADLVCLSHDGNLYDACLLALMESLKRCQLPETEVVEEGVGERAARQSEVCISSTNLRPLPIHHTLVPITIGVMEQQLLADPTAAEEGPCERASGRQREGLLTRVRLRWRDQRGRRLLTPVCLSVFFCRRVALGAGDDRDEREGPTAAGTPAFACWPCDSLPLLVADVRVPFVRCL